MSLILSGTDNSAAVPAYKGSDLDTGLYFPAANTVALSVGGVEAMRIDSNGEIRATSHVRGTGSDQLFLIGGASNNNNNIYIGGSSAGTANTIVFTTNGTEKVRLTSAGSFQVGSTSADTNKLWAYDSSVNSVLKLRQDGVGPVQTWHGNGGGELIRVTRDGNFFINTTSNLGSNVKMGILYAGGGTEYGIELKPVTNGTVPINFRTAGGSTVGYIYTDASATSYLSTSDYRLKHDIAPMTGALAKVALLKPCTYKWNVDNSDGQGFIAHELAEVIPQAVTGQKDEVETYIDEDGNEQTRPKYQGVDTSFVVATLAAAIQEQQAIIQSLTARIEALEGK